MQTGVGPNVQVTLRAKRLRGRKRLQIYNIFSSRTLLGPVQRGRFVNAKSASQEAPMHSLDRKRSEYDCIR